MITIQNDNKSWRECGSCGENKPMIQIRIDRDHSNSGQSSFLCDTCSRALGALIDMNTNAKKIFNIEEIDIDKASK